MKIPMEFVPAPASKDPDAMTLDELRKKRTELTEKISELSMAMERHGETADKVQDISSPEFRDFGFSEQMDELTKEREGINERIEALEKQGNLI